MKSLPRIAVGLLILAMVCPLVWAADPEIAVWEAGGRRTKAVVMDADGSHRTLIFERKFSRLSTSPSWSPSGDWVAIRAEDDNGAALYKVRVDGSDLTKVLCSVGTDRDDEPFDILGGSGLQWSPGGEWILIGAGTEGEPWLGIIGADEEPDANCKSNLIPLYYPGWEPGNQTGWWMQDTPAWNHDGSKIAVFEDYETVDSQTDWRLQILEISLVNGEPTVSGQSPVWPLPLSLQLVMESFAVFDPDWQRQGGDLLTFDTREGGVWWVSWIDSTTGAWGHLTEGANASWSPDNSRIAYNGPIGPGVIISDLLYDEIGIPSVVNYQTIGSGVDPDWKRDQLIIGCESDSECDDGKECTVNDLCNASGQCIGTPVADGNTCDFPNGICCGGTCSSPACSDDLDCDDGDSCTSDSCFDGNTCAANCENGPDPFGGTDEICNDGIDNDCDGLVDCADSADCSDDPACLSVDCSQFTTKRSCNTEASCRWDNRIKVCLSR